MIQNLKFAKNIQGYLLLIILVFGIFTGSQIHLKSKYVREDWKELINFIQAESSSKLSIWFSDSESQLPFKYYYNSEDFEIIKEYNPPICNDACWYILRQPYTLTHAFTQAISRANQEWIPIIPDSCSIVNTWDKHTGIIALEINCKD